MRQGKYIVEIWDWEEFGLSCFKPSCFSKRLAFRAMTITAGIVRISLFTARITDLNMPS
jgi:hypothetical protein